MKFQVVGSDAATGKDKAIEIEANDEAAAAAAAKLRGIFPFRVTALVPPRPKLQQPACPICRKGTLSRRLKYRMSAPVVLIGYILLVPTIFGIAFGLFGIVVSASTFWRVFWVLFILAWFVNGLLGWLLVMQKWVLQCDHCGGSISA